MSLAVRGACRYGYVERDGVELHLSESPEHERHVGVEIYLYVSDADRLYTAWSASGVKGRFIAPHDTEYGLREFAFVDRERNGAPRRFATFCGVIARLEKNWRRAASP